ncbi:Uncharacterized conserved protein, DUF885 familyt [Massilia sp. PDC64]|nr:DUF885 domain-containing protein [Massilia sp. PDC64]SDE25057.1 Uncharacterized conserved protein, DUF885 familyt [Massilia sp. PDC64]
MRRLFATLILLGPLVAFAADAADQAQALFERDWQWRLKHQPEFATNVGDHRYDALLADTSLAEQTAVIEHARRMLDLARQIDRAQLAGQDRLSWDLFTGDQERILARAAFVAFDPQPVSAQDGLQIRFPQLVAQMPFFTEDDYRNYIARLNALPRHIDGIIEQMREGMRTGWTAPKAIMAGLAAQLRAMREHVQDGALGAPFQRLPATIPEETRTQLATDGAAALRTAAGALQKLEDFVRTDYLPAARTTIGASSLPGGAAWYAFLVKAATTTTLTPAEIHALGVKEVARLRAEMEATAARTGFKGSYPQFVAFVRSDPRLFPTGADALLDRYRRTIARVQAQLPTQFGTIPQEELAVKPVQQASADTQGGAYYEAGTPERVAALVVNTSRLDTRPLWEVETLALHEGIPGHHLQVARAHAIDGLPAFRRHAWYPAFGEGWALYAESLGPQLGLMRDPFSQFGRLADEQLRAARLVVDTGIHALGWPRQQAIDWLNANTANPPSDNEVEVDRMIARPGQALAYKIGQLRIAALRARAQAALGPRFDVRAFHDAVLENGALPLEVLEKRVDRWIAAQNVPEPAAVR